MFFYYFNFLIKSMNVEASILKRRQRINAVLGDRRLKKIKFSNL